jgi:spermidine synthase
MLGVFAFTLFCSASLLFLVEPMAGKMMLPLLGGTPAVWNTCMVFFQAVLLAGYAYAHASTAWLGPRKQAALHIAVLGLPLAFFAFNGPLAVNGELIAGRESNPIPALLLVLTLSVGVPMFVVCTSAPLLQRWFASTDHPAAADPYFLYGASNLGSMLALVGYPVLVEPYLTLRGQRVDWAVGYAGLTLLTALCAVLMWKARPAPVLAAPQHVPQTPEVLHAIKTEARDQKRDARPVTWLRRMRWVALAIVPSSLMLGATTYITTDIAAIPLLWVLPLALYLLTFIIVFARMSPRTQQVVTIVGIDLLTLLWIWWAQYLFEGEVLAVVRRASLALLLLSFLVLLIRGPDPMHRFMTLIMPLLVLLSVVVMLSEFRVVTLMPRVALHLLTLFVVSMVCHGELARDRPAPSHLTEYFLWMSFGGVVGGLFNGLLAPLVFNGIVEYHLMMVVACLLLPPLALSREAGWARLADLVLAGVFTATGLILLWLRGRDLLPGLGALEEGGWKWTAGALLGGLVCGGVAAWQGWGSPPAAEGTQARGHWLDRLLDVALPAALLVLVLGLYWGLKASGVRDWVDDLAGWIDLDPYTVAVVLTFSLPAVLCFSFVERPLRFALGVGAILFAGGFSHLVRDSVVYQARSFFGVLRVKRFAEFKDGYRYPFAYLDHGTTTHGKQFLDPSLRHIPLSYFHRTGPVGRVMQACNTDPARAVAVIGLGTGTLACYAHRGQTFDFFDIDPVVVDIAFDTNEYFTFVEDAERRGANVNLILGDARLTFDPASRIDHARLMPLHQRKGKQAPGRSFRPDLSRDQKYGLIVVDAFSSDAIPIHLITREAVAIYRDRLLDDGVLCMHISNRYLDLQPVLANIVEELGLVGYHLSDDDEAPVAKLLSHWVVIARKKEHLEKVLFPPRWQRSEAQQALLAAALWPAQAGTALGTSVALAHALVRVVDVDAAAEAKSAKEPPASDWRPLDTPSSLARRLEQESDPERQEALRDRIATSARVGVWSDDYSNLLSVFNPW